MKQYENHFKVGKTETLQFGTTIRRLPLLTGKDREVTLLSFDIAFAIIVITVEVIRWKNGVTTV